MADDLVLPIPNLTLAQDYFILSSPSLAHLHQNSRKSLLEGIQADRTSHVHSTNTLSVETNRA